MSERKVLNKYYPPDFDPNKIPRLKRPKNRQFSIRIMAPFNMRCSNCGEYIYKGKKFNSRQERVEDEDYLGLMIFRFYIKCPRCVAEISFKTDPQNCDYALEAGATRNFEALRTAERLAEQELKEKEEEEKNNPMKVLENRTKASQQEMEMLETLEELRELNSRHAKVDHEEVLRRHKAYEEQLRQLQDEEDEQFIQSIFGKSISGETVKRVHDEDDVKDDGESFSSISLPAKIPCIRKPTDILTEGSRVTTKDSEISSSTQDKKPAPAKINKDASSWQKSIGSLSKKNSLLGIVKKKKSVKTSSLSVDKSPAEQLKDERTRTENSETTATTTTACYGVKDSVNDSAAVSRDVNKSNESRQIEAVDGKGASSKPSALGMLGAYSDTSSDDSN